MSEAPQPRVPCALVIFGAAGDLTHRLLVPALYHLRRRDLLADKLAIIGVARSDISEEAFRARLRQGVRETDHRAAAEADWKWLASRMTYLRGDFDAAETYARLAARLAEADRSRHTGGNYLFYLATPPQAFATIVRRLGEAGLVRETDGRWRRVVVEKPFGTDLHSAQELNGQLLSVLQERQVFRIDHYLGKETVQNIMVLRFGNGIFEPLWNRNHIDHVQITVAETVGVEHRGAFYERTGALRDMVPNHLLQLLALVGMEPPTCFAADAVRAEKTKLLDAVRRLDAGADVVRGQYGAGAIAGRAMAAYRRAPDVAPDSTTETYVALKLMTDNWRWAGVPFYLRTGKALARRHSEIVVRFRQAPLALFRDTPVERLTPNDLVLSIQPEEGVTLRFGAKIPGPAVQLGDVAMRFDYRDYFNAAPNTGYETLIYDAMIGDATLFKRADDIEAGWRIVQPALDAWAADRAAAPAVYAAGSSGPRAADALIERDGRHWRALVGDDIGLTPHKATRVAAERRA